MAPITRREFVGRAAAGTAIAGVLRAAWPARLAAAPFGWPIGSQTYPHQSYIRDGKFADLCKMMADIGVTRLELCSPFGYDGFKSLADPKETKKIMADHGLKSESGHFDLVGRAAQGPAEQHRLGQGNRHDPDGLRGIERSGQRREQSDARSGEESRRRVQPDRSGGGEERDSTGAAQRAVRAVDGRRRPDVRPAVRSVRSHARQDAIPDVDDHSRSGRRRLLREASRAVHLLARAGRGHEHPRRAARASGRRRPGSGPVHPQVAVGKGSIDWTKTFQAARKAGVKNYFVEQNWELTQASVAYLKTLKV